MLSHQFCTCTTLDSQGRDSQVARSVASQVGSIGGSGAAAAEVRPPRMVVLVLVLLVLNAVVAVVACEVMNCTLTLTPGAHKHARCKGAAFGFLCHGSGAS